MSKANMSLILSDISKTVRDTMQRTRLYFSHLHLLAFAVTRSNSLSLLETRSYSLALLAKILNICLAYAT